MEVFITDPSGRRGTVEPTLEARGDGTYRCTYRPTAEGPHAVHVAFGGAPIPKSPFNVTVGQGEPRGAPLSPPPSTGGLWPSYPPGWGSLSFPGLGVSVLLSPLNLGVSVLPSLGTSVPPTWGSLSPLKLGVFAPPPPTPSLGVSVPSGLGGGLCPAPMLGALRSPPLRAARGGGGLCPSQLGGGGLCAFCPPTQGGCLCASAPPRALVGGSLPPTWGARGCRCRGVLAPRDSALSLSTCPAPSARLSGKRRPGSSRVTH